MNHPLTNIVVPFKDPSRAKERLSEFLSLAQRSELAVTLFESTLDVLSSLPSKPHVLVVTDSSSIEVLSRKRSAEVLLEKNSSGETQAIEKATQWSIEHGFARQIVIPGDMADLDGLEVEQLLATVLPPPSVVLCPAVGDDGTNAIMTSPPNALSFRFGKASFPEYLLRAAETRVSARVLRLPSLVLDIDTPEDLKIFSTHETEQGGDRRHGARLGHSRARARAHSETKAFRLLETWGISLHRDVLSR